MFFIIILIVSLHKIPKSENIVIFLVRIVSWCVNKYLSCWGKWD